MIRFVFRGVKVEVTEQLADYARRKLGRLNHYFDRPPDCMMTVKMRALKDGHRVEATVSFDGMMMRAEEKSGDMYTAIDKVQEKLERQVRRWRVSRFRGLRGPEAGGEGVGVSVSDDVTGRTDGNVGKARMERKPTAAMGGFKIVRNKRFAFKPMDVGEAVLRMNLLDHNFFVFRDLESDEVNVVYRRKDGNYGVISPRKST
ncbi:sigma-54 modulation protein [Paenibacillus sp. 32O-W]|uniref:ribosome hibernation-promoting factor, HPF/YfiA family n=1 Tax=Paenibacillus sp. 32O-W TaxID=1695218 RepID=UPI00071EF8E1|nr:ribosome-associated translation inhibitor RaiA [Paenibacillus sp. 32O-W]ALS28126.1 sigma-54 modulation protein [Paenibacillus sp. 32O-W]